MAAPQIQVGQYVQYNPSLDAPNAAPASPIESTIGQVKGAFFSQGQPYYQVIWNPGDRQPKTGLYHGDQLTVLTSNQAQSIFSQIAQGTFTPNLPKQSSQFQANLPVQALPPSIQGAGTFEAGAPSTDQPTIQQTS